MPRRKYTLTAEQVAQLISDGKYYFEDALIKEYVDMMRLIMPRDISSPIEARITFLNCTIQGSLILLISRIDLGDLVISGCNIEGDLKIGALETRGENQTGGVIS